jgi:hypothetical protein
MSRLTGTFALLVFLACAAICLSSCSQNGGGTSKSPSTDPFAAEEQTSGTYGPQQLSDYLNALAPAFAASNRLQAAADKRYEAAVAKARRTTAVENLPVGIKLRQYGDYSVAALGLADELSAVSSDIIPERFKAAHRLLIRGEESIGQADFNFSVCVLPHITYRQMDATPTLLRRYKKARTALNKAYRSSGDLVTAWHELVKAEVRRLSVTPPGYLLPSPQPTTP